MIVKTVSQCEFIDEFRGMTHSFSPYGLKALYEYLEDYSEDTGESIELDTIAIMTEFDEFQDWKEYEDLYDLDFQVTKPCCDICKEYRHKENLEKLSEYTTVIPIFEDSEGFIIQIF